MGKIFEPEVKRLNMMSVTIQGEAQISATNFQNSARLKCIPSTPSVRIQTVETDIYWFEDFILCF